MLRKTRYKVLESNITNEWDALVQKIIAEAIQDAVDFCVEKGLLDPDHERVYADIKVVSDVPSDLFEPENFA